MVNGSGYLQLVWGSMVVFRPDFFFMLGNLELPNYEMIWQTIGMIGGVYGVGYLIAAHNPEKHWVVVMVGLLRKIWYIRFLELLF